MAMHLWQPVQTFGVMASAFKSLCNITPDHPDARSKVNISRNLVCCKNMAPFILSTSMEQIEKGLFRIQRKVEKKNKLPWRCFCLYNQETKESMWMYQHLFFSEGFCLNLVPANGIALLLTLILLSLSLSRNVFKAVPELHFIFLIVPSYMSLGKVYSTTSCPQLLI